MVDTSLPGVGSEFGQAQADALYLSKVNDDTAAGALTFEGATTHEGGIKLPSITSAGALGTDADGNIIVGSGGGGGGLWTENAGAIYPTTLDNNVGIGRADQNSSKLTVFKGDPSDDINRDDATITAYTDGGNGISIGTKASNPYQRYIQSGFVPDFSAGKYDLLLNPLGGKVGIGTDNPLQLLDVESDSNPQIKVSATDTGTNSAGLFIENQGQRNWQIWADRPSSQLRIGHNSRATTVVTVTDTSMGIGTDNVQATFHVNGDAWLQGNAWFGGIKENFPGNGNTLAGGFIESTASGPSVFISRLDNTPLVLNTNIDTGIMRFKKTVKKKATSLLTIME